ncbi:MAG: hypothetical protein ACJ780_24510 [Solirubrobacteraceae bacterium]
MSSNVRKCSARRKLSALLLGMVVLLAGAAAVRGATTADLSLVVMPVSQTINSGSSASYTVALTPSNGFNGAVTLAAGNLPNGMLPSWTVNGTTTSAATATMNVPAGSQGVSATVTISGGQPKAATYTPTVTATSGALSHTTAMTLVVLNQNAANYNLSVSPPSQTLVQGTTATATVSLTRANLTGAVALTASGLPAGVTASFSPASVTGSTSTLTLTANSSVPAGVSTVTVTGAASVSGSSTTRSAAFTLITQNATTASAAAPATDPTNSPIAASAISSVLSNTTSGASGTVTFKVFGPQASAPTSCTTGGTTVGTANVTGSGTYNPSAGYTPPTAGTYWWYANYSGDTYDAASSSPCGAAMASTVIKNTTAATAAGPATSPATAAISATSISASLSGATTSPAATGPIIFYVYGPSATAPTTCPGASNWTTVGTATASGTATYHPSTGYTPSVGGTYWWYVSYAGDTYNSPASSACGSGMTSTVVQDFKIGASPSIQTALTGGTSDDTATYFATVTPLGAYSGTVNLSVPGGLPAGTSANFSPSSTSGDATLTLDAGTSVAPGTYTLTIQGRATIGGVTVTRSIPVSLVIQASQPLTLSGNVPNPLYPGAPAQSFAVTITNPNSFSVHVNSLGSVGIQPVNAPGCQTSWFQVTLPSLPSGGIAVGDNGTASLTASARMLDENTAQDACQGKQLTLTYTGSYGK